MKNDAYEVASRWLKQFTNVKSLYTKSEVIGQVSSDVNTGKSKPSQNNVLNQKHFIKSEPFYS